MVATALGLVSLIFLAGVVAVVISRDTENRIAHDVGVALLTGSLLAGAVFVARGSALSEPRYWRTSGLSGRWRSTRWPTRRAVSRSLG